MRKAIPGFENYIAEDDGRIYSLLRNKYLKPKTSRFGYATVVLYAQGKKHYCMVHRLIAQTFLPTPKEDETQINHKDENKLNNEVSNLEWCTSSYNINYGRRNAVVSAKQIVNKTKTVARKIDQVDVETGEVIKVWPSLRAIERELGIAHSNIYACCSGKRHTRLGYAWRYHL